MHAFSIAMKHFVSVSLLRPSSSINFLILLYVSSFSICFIAASNHSVNDQQQALLSFKALITDDPFGALASWSDESLHFCQWRGVMCSSNHRDSHQPRVTALELESLNLVGKISPSLANLTFLRSLHLPENELQGPIPPELGSLSDLQHLNLSFNPLGGEIPMNLFQNCSNLQTLSLSGNNLLGMIPRNFNNCLHLQSISLKQNMLRGEIPSNFDSLSKLKVLSLTDNQLTGSISSVIGSLASITGLYLADNLLTGAIPTSVGNLTTLTELVLARNGLGGVIPPPLWNSSLVTLDVQGNHLHGPLPHNFGANLISLQFLYVNDNRFYGRLPSSWPNAPNVKVIQLDYNNFTGTIPNNFGTLQSLFFLQLGYNQLEARDALDWSFLDALANCTNLQILVLSDNKLAGRLPRSIGNLSTTTLERLSMENNQIGGDIPAGIGNLLELAELLIDFNNLNGSIPLELGRLPRLVKVSLRGNFFGGEIPTTLGNLTSLSFLDLSNNELQGSLPTSLGKCPLEALYLQSNNITGVLPKEILSIPTLTQRFNVSDNLLTGTLPQQVGNLKNIQGLYVSNNRMSGEIPGAIGQCQILQHLYMQGNSFEGPIPLSLAQLKGLQELDLSRNNLSGTIPDFLGSVLNLTRLNLSYNSLHGEVPKDGVFSNASSYSVMGNNDLCGGVPETKLPPCQESTSKKKHFPAKILVIILVVGVPLCFIIFCLFVGCYLLKRSTAQTSTEQGFKEKHQRVSFSELFNATDGFSTANLIGIGSFGSVFKGTINWEDHKDVAVKVLNLQQEGASRSFSAECEALRNIRHRNLVKLLTSCSSIDFQGNDFKALVFEFLPNGSLDEWLHPKENGASRLRTLTLIDRLNISIDVACALDYLHQNGPTPIVHCDLKPSNVLLDNDLVAHVSDFGLARFLKRTESKSYQSSTSSAILKGSIGYVAPEYGIGNKASAEGDVYSYGTLLLETFTGKRPTADVFEQGLGIHHHVEMALPGQVVKIIDPQLLADEGLGDGGTDGRDLECIMSTLRIGILCTKELPTDRMHMHEVVRELQKVRDLFLSQASKENGIAAAKQANEMVHELSF